MEYLRVLDGGGLGLLHDNVQCLEVGKEDGERSGGCSSLSGRRVRCPDFPFRFPIPRFVPLFPWDGPRALQRPRWERRLRPAGRAGFPA